MPLWASVYMCLVATCWERADLLALVCGVQLWVCHFPIGTLDQVWYLIVSIPDLCTLTYYGKGWPLGSRLWCLTVSLSLSHWYPGLGVVLDCIDSWSLHPYLLWKGLTSWLSFVVSNSEFVTFPFVSWVRRGTWLYRLLLFAPLLNLIGLSKGNISVPMIKNNVPFIAHFVRTKASCKSRQMVTLICVLTRYICNCVCFVIWVLMS